MSAGSADIKSIYADIKSIFGKALDVLQNGGHFRPSALAPPFAKSAQPDVSTVVGATWHLNVFANARGRFAKSRGRSRPPVHAVVVCKVNEVFFDSLPRRLRIERC